jgi:diguanylate cyclase (GGDEF)-like protein
MRQRQQLSFPIFPQDDPSQSHRLRRFFMAAAASLMVIGLLFAAWLAGMLTQRAFVGAAGMIAAYVLLFYAVLRSRINLRAGDPSLTLLQILAATVATLYVLFEADRGHGVLFLIYMVSFLFGVFRLSTRQLLGLSGFVSISYGAIVLLQARVGYSVEPFQVDLLRWLVLTVVLCFFSVMGGYISSLRKRLADHRQELEQALARIERLATHDELTGVYNRRRLNDALDVEIKRTQRYGSALAMCLIDIDHFKSINDTYGHHAGDIVLQSLSTAVRAQVRPTDLFGRYGGEEFLMILPQTPLEGALVVAERLRRTAETLQIEGLPAGLRITVSAGVSVNRAGEPWSATLERADAALYCAKRDGRNRVQSELS